MNEKAKKLAVILGVCAAVVGIALAGSAYMQKSIQEDRIESTRKHIECEALKKTVTFEMFLLSGYSDDTMEMLLKKKVDEKEIDVRSAKIVSALIPMQGSWAKTDEKYRDYAIWSLGSRICMNM